MRGNGALAGAVASGEVTIMGGGGILLVLVGGCSIGERRCLDRRFGREHKARSAHVSGNSEARSVGLPAKVIVSLRAGFVLALANVVCVGILAYAWTKTHRVEKSIQVTGSAKKVIVSDLIVWTAKVSNADPDLGKAYVKLEASVAKARGYLKARGIADSAVRVSSVSTARQFKRDVKGNVTDEVSQYVLEQDLTVSSEEVAKVAETARSVTELIREGVMIESVSPRYFYTKLADLKVAMLAEATKDAAVRAEKIASNSGAVLGTVSEARMGVMQINARYDDETSGGGVNDTSSLEKEITGIVTASFSIR